MANSNSMLGKTREDNASEAFLSSRLRNNTLGSEHDLTGVLQSLTTFSQ
jgi:hypothetical protein